MTLPDRLVTDFPGIQRNFEDLDGRFPIRSADIADGTVTDTDLASPNNGVYRTIASIQGGFVAGTGGNSYFVAGNGTVTANGGSSANGVLGLVDIQAADYAVNGKTARLRTTLYVASNATAPANTHIGFLFPTAWAGGIGAQTLTLGSVVTGSGATVASPAASLATRAVSGDYTLPTDGLYCLGVTRSGTATLNNIVSFLVLLEMRHT